MDFIAAQLKEFSMALFLTVIAVLATISAYVLLKKLQSATLHQLALQKMKSRVGLGLVLELEETHHRCFWCSIGKALAPKITGKEGKRIQARLVSAGFRLEQHYGAYYFLKYALGLVLAITIFFGWVFVDLPILLIGLVPLVFVLVPEWILISLSEARLSKINQNLPDFLDMCNVCMNAGLSYLVAVKRVSRELKHMHPEICYEFEFMLDQIQIGVPRVEALKQLAERNPTKDIKNLVQLLIQNEKMGSPISEAIAQFSKRMYQDRQNLMEERAAKASAKMAIIILPFLLFPYMVLLLGERMVNLARGF